MEEKAASPPPLPLKVTPGEVSGRCTVMGPAAARVGEPCEGRSGYGREVEESVRADKKKRRRLQRPMGFVHMFVQVRKILKAAGTKKSEHGGKKCPKECVVDICSLALWLALPHPAAPNSCSLVFWFGTSVLL